MSTSLIGGLVRRGTDAGMLAVSDPVPAQLERLARDFGVRGTADNVLAVRDADLVVLAVKPQEMAAVARGISRELAGRRRIVISIAAGIRLADLGRWLGDGTPTVRAMPNRPALIGAGITALYAASDVAAADRAAVEELMAAAGETVWLEDEAQMDVVTAVSGSGPAYFFLLIEALEAAGVELGLTPATARKLAVATAQGAGRMASVSGESPAVLREQVTSKGGTTAAALEVLEESAVRSIFRHAVTAAARRSGELAHQFGGH
jgi:pyrroline-5-carboxylate reductase